MKIEVGERGMMILREVYNPIKLITNKGEEFVIAMRDGGFEYLYDGKWHSLQSGMYSEAAQCCPNCLNAPSEDPSIYPYCSEMCWRDGTF